MKGFLRLLPPWTALAVLLTAGLPLFLCMPLWADATLYDLCARNVLTGGIHYRDVFDTNLPGMLWLHLLVRGLLGWSSEALRLADFLVYAGVVVLLARWLRRDGATPAVGAWTAFALFAFYFSLTEWCHCQRDTWMLLPALAALSLHRLRLGPAGPRLVLALGEGVLWGAAFWIKPFVVLPALACWLAGVVLRRRAGRPWLGDTAAVAAGVAAALVPGLIWLGTSGTWPYFCDVFLHWNPEYNSNAPGLLPRTRLLYRALWPWGLVQLAAVPPAVAILLRAVRQPDRTSPRGDVLLAAFCLGWLGQAVYVQKGYDYSLASAVPPALTLVAGRRWWPGRFQLGWAALAGFAAVAAWRHTLLEADRLALWGRCWREGSSAALRDRLKCNPGPNSPDWADLERVADFLRRRGASGGEVTCYNNSTHPLYLVLGLRPSTPFLHFNTVLACFPSRREEVRKALAVSGQRYVVSDLCAVPLREEDALAQRPGHALALPPAFPERMTRIFPWSLPVVFRAGRYLVHEATGEVGPLWPPTVAK
jgi:hypothetical protein